MSTFTQKTILITGAAGFIGVSRIEIYQTNMFDFALQYNLVF